MDEGWRLTAKMDAMRLRAQMFRSVRRFFYDQDFLEVETPARIPAPAPESHIDAVPSGDWFLHTSPELCMKRLLAAGYPKIFQICKCFRAGERGARHLPEFTILEWYRAGADYRTLMEDCEALISDVAGELGGRERLPWQGRMVSLQRPWERLSVKEAFARHTRLTVSDALKADRFDEAMACDIEPHLGLERPVFLYDYPAELGALARVKIDAPGIAERFELYIGGVELANAFSELTDAKEQRRRFEHANSVRLLHGQTACPISESFLAALPRMPPSAGIALGLDRLAMIMADKDRIDDVVAFTSETL